MAAGWIDVFRRVWGWISPPGGIVREPVEIVELRGAEGVTVQLVGVDNLAVSLRGADGVSAELLGIQNLTIALRGAENMSVKLKGNT